MAWWLIYTEPRRETLVKAALEAADVGVLYLHERVKRRVEVTVAAGYRRRVLGRGPERIHRRWKLTDRDEPVFARYLFVECPEHGLAVVCATRGVVGTVCGAERRPITVHARVIEALRRTCRDGDGLTTTRDLRRLSDVFAAKVGDRFTVAAGPFTGFMAQISSLARLDKSGDVDAWIDVMGRLAPLTLNYNEVGRVISGSQIAGALDKAA